LFFQLLNRDELSSLVAYQNRVIADLPKPPKDQVDTYPEFLRHQYLSYFEPQQGFDAVKSWMRYRTLAHVDGWSEILGSLLPQLDKRARSSLRPDQLYLGKGPIVPRNANDPARGRNF